MCIAMVATVFLAFPLMSGGIKNLHPGRASEDHLAQRWIKGVESRLQHESPSLWGEYMALDFHEKCHRLQSFHRRDFMEHRTQGTGDVFSEVSLIRAQKRAQEFVE